MDKETLEKQIRSYKGENLGEFISDLIDKEKKVKQLMRKGEDDLKSAKRVSKLIEKGILLEIENIQNNMCPHIEYTYCPDPSGNNDWYYKCDWCGKEW